MQEAVGDFAALIRRARAYDRVAFAEIYRFAVTPVYRYLSARSNGVEEAEELTQAVFTAALAGIQGLRAEDETGLLAWLFQIARYKLADQLRQRYRRPSAPIEEAEQIEAPQPRPDEVVVVIEDRAELRQAIEQLTAEQRDVILYKYALEYDNEQTARLLGKTINAVNQMHHRALASLHRLLVRAEKAR